MCYVCVIRVINTLCSVSITNDVKLLTHQYFVSMKAHMVIILNTSKSSLQHLTPHTLRNNTSHYIKTFTLLILLITIK